MQRIMSRRLLCGILLPCFLFVPSHSSLHQTIVPPQHIPVIIEISPQVTLAVPAGSTPSSGTRRTTESFTLPAEPMPFSNGPSSITEKDRRFLRDIEAYVSSLSNVRYQTNEEKKYLRSHPPSRFHWHCIPRWSYLKNRWHSFWDWFKDKDTAYAEKNKRGELRQEWETMLGTDIFHVYYKYKDARDILKNKVSFSVPHMKVCPEYTDKQLKIIFRKKF